MNLIQDIKRMLSALAHANAGDYLSPRQKARCLAGSNAATPPAVADPVARQAQPQVGLYLGSELSPEVMSYAIQTCARLRYGLTVLTFLSEAEAEERLQPYRPELKAAGVPLTVHVLTGEPLAGLAHGLRRHREVAFLVANEGGYLGQSLIHGTLAHTLPVPVVMVHSAQTAAKQPPAPALASAA